MRHVLTRDLSAGGLSFIHNGYLHVNTRVDVVLRRNAGGEDVISGVIAYCHHIGGTWHVVGAKFEKRIFPKLYVDPDQATSLCGEAKDPKSVTGIVLHVENQELDRRLFAHHLRNTNVTLRGCRDVAEAIPLMREYSFDLVVVELNLDSPDGTATYGVDTIKAIRDAGYHGLLAVCTAETRTEVIAAVQNAGICGLLRKPYEGDRLVAAVGNWLDGGGEGGGDRIYSQLIAQPDMQPLVVEYVENVKNLVAALDEAVKAGDAARCRAVCMTLKGSGTSYGFEPVTSAATEAITRLEGSGSIQESAGAIGTLKDVCSRISAQPAPWGEAAA